MKKVTQGAQKRIDFLWRWAMTFFAVLVVLVGWLGVNIRAEKYDTVFWIGVGFTAVVAVACPVLTYIAHRHIKRLEKSDDA